VPQPAAGIAPRTQPANTPNEFAADDAVIQRTADEYAAQAKDSEMREFATRFRDLADRFAAEPDTDNGNRLRTDILNHLSREVGSAPMTLQMECRETICRLQLTGSEPDKIKTVQDIKDLGGFRQVIGMQRPLGDGEAISDVYLVMN